MLALQQGTVDVCANWWNAPDDCNLTRMLNKGMVKNADGKPMKEDDFRIILKSDLIINSPTAYLADLPADLKAAIRKRLSRRADQDDKAAFDKLSDGKNQPWQPIDNAAYDDTVKLITVRRQPAQAERLSRPDTAVAPTLAAPRAGGAAPLRAVVRLPDRPARRRCCGAYARAVRAPARRSPARPRRPAGRWSRCRPVRPRSASTRSGTSSAISTAISTASPSSTPAPASGPIRSTGSGACGAGAGCSARPC